MIPVCRLEDLPKGESVRIETTPPVAVFHTDDGDLYAIDDTCTHQDASLSEGWLEGCLVECPLHAASFDLRTGRPTCLPARRAVRTHSVTVVDGLIHVHLAAEEGTAA
ncbi:MULTISPECIES: bifunctional 3-phenylpropionate/cinnamic acid dioxygenase ferredoxin subunit [Streptomyces]|uniref:Bifunctional 3-phenylpropionate/cinnamic acid dioxygenase ferredoxin subunit n=1 Tax=Streptomyces koelreuteriae TaxID=2838015 RepID=A0ABX8G0T8_9ACTN|nr:MULTISPECIES: bifunctional 3-phenylpropionate/cinnamic acid dioxygenase ferredoxin subunit [Streptomyces]QWB26913.1 bifunctional 3-phenylpropionate/cinnamic acid dioxygenase ferredoxin subunit [Streptomyces koelreuteriae]UUA09993.1 bifunctional 3-phenylpropionate/cinnamic acid dioxygenase ferredoxin subunit [Streptomyces koelreuteriae]UUA17597.1 bifunctional 3-phenylpropionate/cinnamic acid dioxygenase ferredoxin subunit [Streptomyces sp. CRCS-T-1]